MSDKVVLECVETVNVENLKVILNHQDHFKNLMRPSSFGDEYGFSFEQLKKYMKSANNNEVQVQYKQKRGKGRLFAKGGLSLQSFPREIRATIASDYYYDIDMVNAHPTLLHHICETEIKYDTKYLKVYINDRDKVINEILAINPNETYESVKTCILAILNGGSNLYKTFALTKWMKNFKNEINEIHNRFIEHYPKTCAEVKENKEFNIKGSVMNHILCGWENAMLECMIEYLQDNDFIDNNFVCCFDGIMVPKANIDDLKQVMEDLEEHIFDEYDISLKLKHKEMIGFDMKETPEDIQAEYFKATDNYYWMDFMNDLKSQTWVSLDELMTFTRININRVMLVIATGEIYIKKDNDEPFQFIKELPEYIIKFNESSIGKNGKKTHEEIEMPFKRLYKKHLINLVKMYNNIKLKPLSPMDDVIEQNTDSRDFNVWTGFKAKLLSKNSVNMNLIEKVLNHIKVVWANNDDIFFKYICSWFHTIFKYPYKKSKVAMVFQSKEHQIGKSIIVEDFLIPFVFGNKLSCVEDGIGFATERFNNRIMGKLFVSCEELNNIADTGSYHTAFDSMKKIITNKTMQIEWKNGAKIEIDSFINLILFTNNEFSIKVEKYDARYFITQCNPIYLLNFKYFGELVDSFTQESANHFFSYIYHLEDTTDVRNIPETTIKQEIKLNCLPSPQRFLYRIKELREEKTDEVYGGWKESVIDNDEISGTQLYSHYKSYCQEEHERDLSQTKFGRCIGTMIDKARTNHGLKYQLNSIK